MASSQAPELRARRSRARRTVTALKKEFPSPACALDHETALQLLVATILSAQCTDERVNQVTPDLFAAYPDAESLARARTRIRPSVGVYRRALS